MDSLNSIPLSERKTFEGDWSERASLESLDDILTSFDLSVERGDKFILRYGKLIDTFTNRHVANAYDLSIHSRSTK